MGVVAVVGAGVMGEALLSGLLRGDRMGDTFVVADKRHDRCVELQERYGVDIASNSEAAAEAEGPTSADAAPVSDDAPTSVAEAPADEPIVDEPAPDA